MTGTHSITGSQHYRWGGGGVKVLGGGVRCGVVGKVALAECSKRSRHPVSAWVAVTRACCDSLSEVQVGQGVDM